MEYILCIVLGFYIGYKAAEAILMWTFKKALDELGIGPKELDALIRKLGIEVPDNSAATADATADFPVVPVKIEQQGDMLYMFRKDTDQFLGQATTPEDLIRRVGEKICDVKFTVAKEDGGELLGGIKWNFDQTTKEVTKS